ncbi:MurR/RpiR family transcriptional regulator [Christensenella timonensis]|uniref:MurR/RpiR family transcriptional regulator n=1 Tax=Christensenella timonensis TaxID=1816678 RepID=UPI0008373BA1|nr:MurR/RpiR family transcriptional regulator [Christensenella timonensis]
MQNTENYGILLYIQNNYKNLTNSLQKIAVSILAAPSKVVDNTASELSKDIDVSEASIVRFCQSLGFKGYADFKIKLAKDLGADNTEPVPSGIKRTDSSWDVISKVMQSECEDIRFTLDMIDKESLITCLELICASNRIGFFGVGSSAIVASNAKEHFLHYGKVAQAEQEGMSQIVLANSLHTNDLAFGISISGQSKIPLQALRIAKENGAKTVCLTQNPRSSLAEYSDCVLIAYRKSNSLDDLGTASRIVHTSIIDAIVVAYAARNWDAAAQHTRTNRRNFRIQQFGE